MNTRKLLVSGLIFVSVLLSACAPAATPPAPTAVPPTSIPPTAEPTAALASTLTTFSPKTFKLITSVSFGSDWHVDGDESDNLGLVNGPTVAMVFCNVTNSTIYDSVDGHPTPFPDDFITWIQSDPDFQTSDPTQVTIGGFSGVQIDAMNVTKTDEKRLVQRWNLLKSDGQYRFILLDNVNGERVLIFMIAPTGKTFSAVPELQQEIQSILDSVVFTK